MKTYIIYVKGIEKGYLKAANHNAAEKKARLFRLGQKPIN